MISLKQSFRIVESHKATRFDRLRDGQIYGKALVNDMGPAFQFYVSRLPQERDFVVHFYRRSPNSADQFLGYLKI